jgi:hypothetical protein
MGFFMRKRSFSPLILAFGVIWAASASADSTHKAIGGSMAGSGSHGSAPATSATGAISSGKMRAFTTPAELSGNKTVPVKYGGGAPPAGGGSGGGSSGSSGSSGTGATGLGSNGSNFGFGRPLKAPIIKPKGNKAKARAKQ